MGFSIQRPSSEEIALEYGPFCRNGFTINFDHYKVSVQFGTTSLCDQPDDHGYCPNAEVAVCEQGEDNLWATREAWSGAFGEELDDDVVANVTPEQLTILLAHVLEWMEANHA
jgi:hypothetical protein